MPKTQKDYSQTIIYKLCCKNISIIDIYIGHTTNFNQRKHNHKTICNNKNTKNYNLNVYKFIRNNGGWDNWSMIQIEELNCNNSREAALRERFWIETLKPKLNTVNSFTFEKEKILQKKEWYEEKKDYILQKAKENYQENKEEKNEYQKQYAKENSEHISERQKEYREKNKEKLTQQKKEYRELHKEEAAKANKDWRQANKDKIKATNSEIIDCECGNQHTFGNKHRHLQSKKHTDYQNKLCGIIKEQDSEITEEEKKNIIKQKQKEYRIKNAEKIKEYKKKYNDANKETNSQTTKKYYEEHKNEIIKQNKKYIEENKEKIKKYKDEWYQKNKEKIIEKQNKLFICECGSEIKSASKNDHNKTTKHKKYIQENTEKCILINEDF